MKQAARRAMAVVMGAAVLAVVFAVKTVPASAAERPPPMQFVAKLYSEALGRLPEPGGWVANLDMFRRMGCNPESVRSSVRGFYTSAEFLARDYDNQERVLTLYRGALNREPEQSGFDDYVKLLDKKQVTWSQIVEAFAGSTELARLVSVICGSDASYYFGTQPAPTLSPSGGGFGNGTGAQLQEALNATPVGGTVYLAQKALVRLSSTLVIPAGRTLMTVGSPGPDRYAKQARLVRSSSFPAAMVQLQSGARLLNVWVDGQRGTYTNYTLAAINVQLMGGDGTTVSGSKISNSQGWTSLQAFGTSEGWPCAAARISDNVVTAYSSDHYVHDGVGRFTDGLSIACENAVVENNSVIDATDVGVVLFRAHPAVQSSLIRNNRVLNAGNSAYGAFSVDGLYGQGTTPDFTGAQLVGNTFWTSPDTHVDFGLAIGTRPWFGGRSDTGTGIQVRDNSTDGLLAVVGTGIAISGMYRATVQGNDVRSVSVQEIGSCPHVAVAVDDEGYAAGSDVQSGGVPVTFTSGTGGGCIGH